MPIALSSEPCASTTDATSPSTISEKYSAGPNLSARLARAARRARSRGWRVPATNDPMAAVASATPARPCRAMRWPSSAVTTDEVSPGRLTRIAVVDPPYWAP